MRFLNQLCGCVAAAVFLLCAATAAATPVAPPFALPDAVYSLDVSTATCDGIDCAKAYVKQLLGTVPGTLQVGCSADVGAPNCAGNTLLAAPAPLISVEASTAPNHQSQNSVGFSTVVYYYEVLCDTCSPGTLLPLSIGGAMEAHYVQGTGGTVTFADHVVSSVYGYNPVTSKDNVLVDTSIEGMDAQAVDLTKDGNPFLGAAPNGFGFCESTWTGFYNCSSGPSSPYGTVFYARVNEPYHIELDAEAAVSATNQPFSTSLAEANIDPVISFAPGFDSTGFSLAESAGIGNTASAVPEPATWMLVSIAALGWGCSRMLRRMQGKRSGVR